MTGETHAGNLQRDPQGVVPSSHSDLMASRSDLTAPRSDLTAPRSDLTAWYDWDAWQQQIAATRLARWWGAMRDVAEPRLRDVPHGDVPGWVVALQSLREALVQQDPVQAKDALQKLHPWRKGPLTIGSIDIDTEWRSDWKWRRFEQSQLDLRGKLVLDVGCGNGYYLARALEAGAHAVLGIDPYWLYVMQWLAYREELQRRPMASPTLSDAALMSGLPAMLLPLGLEELPSTPDCFDVIFSWGILAHRRSPLDHLVDLWSRLTPGGHLVLETLVLQNAPGQVLVPRDRYAQMRNVWFVPDTQELVGWLQRVGFHQVRVIDVTRTTTDEQRQTEWMQYLSLTDALDPTAPHRTIEGYPAPVRAMLMAEKSRSS